jgi:hypothetical protein
MLYKACLEHPARTGFTQIMMSKIVSKLAFLGLFEPNRWLLRIIISGSTVLILNLDRPSFGCWNYSFQDQM